MPNKVINIPTVGPVNFPDSMSDADISTAIQKNYPHLAPTASAQAPQTPAQEAPKSLPNQAWSALWDATHVAKAIGVPAEQQRLKDLEQRDLANLSAGYQHTPGTPWAGTDTKAAPGYLSMLGSAGFQQRDIDPKTGVTQMLSPGNLALTGGASLISDAGMLGKSASAAMSAYFGYKGYQQAKTPQQPGELPIDALGRRVAGGAQALLGGLHAANYLGGEAREAIQQPPQTPLPPAMRMHAAVPPQAPIPEGMQVPRTIDVQAREVTPEAPPPIVSSEPAKTPRPPITPMDAEKWSDPMVDAALNPQNPHYQARLQVEDQAYRDAYGPTSAATTAVSGEDIMRGLVKPPATSAAPESANLPEADVMGDLASAMKQHEELAAQLYGAKPSKLAPGQELPRPLGQTVKSQLPPRAPAIAPVEPVVPTPPVTRPKTSVPSEKLSNDVEKAMAQADEAQANLARMDLTPAQREGWQANFNLARQNAAVAFNNQAKLLGPKALDLAGGLRNSVTSKAVAGQADTGINDKIDYLAQNIKKFDQLAALEKEATERKATGQEDPGAVKGTREALHRTEIPPGTPGMEEGGAVVMPGPSQAERESIAAATGLRRATVADPVYMRQVRAALEANLPIPVPQDDSPEFKAARAQLENLQAAHTAFLKQELRYPTEGEDFVNAVGDELTKENRAMLLKGDVDVSQALMQRQIEVGRRAIKSHGKPTVSAVAAQAGVPTAKQLTTGTGKAVDIYHGGLPVMTQKIWEDYYNGPKGKAVPSKQDRIDKLAELNLRKKRLEKFASTLESFKGQKGVVGESPRTPEDIIRASGLVYKGELMGGSGVHMFEHPNYPGKTSALETKSITSPEVVRAKMAETLQTFADRPSGLGETPTADDIAKLREAGYSGPKLLAGVTAGMTTGALAGGAIAGPVGAVAGAAVGAIAGAAAAGAAVNLSAEINATAAKAGVQVGKLYDWWKTWINPRSSVPEVSDVMQTWKGDLDKADYHASQVMSIYDKWGATLPKADVLRVWDPLESTCRHASLSIL